MLSLPKLMLVLLAVTQAGVLASAQDRKPVPPPPAAPKPVAIKVLAIRATRSNAEISPELRDLAEALKRQFKFTGFKLEASRTGAATLAQVFSAVLIGGYNVKVTPRNIEERRVQLQVQVFKEKERKLDIVTTTAKKQFILYMFPLLGEDQLIVAVSAR